MNPYDWQSHNPTIEIPRPELSSVADTLRHGGSAVVFGGRGMGKSVFLRQLKTTLERDGDLRVVLISAPPPELTVRACLDLLARRLDVSEGAINSGELVDAYFARNDVPERLVLLYDEFDRYAEQGDQRSANPPGRGLFNDLEATRRDVPPLGVLATGSIGVYVVRDVLGSSFLARAQHVSLLPFERPDLDVLAQLFAEHSAPLSEAVQDALHLATGGIPALLTFGLQQLWKFSPPPVERDVADVFADFLEIYGDYVPDLVRSVSDPLLSPAPQRVLERIRKTPGPIPRAALKKACGPQEGSLKLELVDVFRLLGTAGLVRFSSRSPARTDPVMAYPIAGLLNLPTFSPAPEQPLDHLRRDLRSLLEKLHRSSADFFRPGPRDAGGGKQLVPEAVFAAHLALGFELLGWQAEREAQNAAGRTDLKLRRNGSGEVVVIEVKIWGRNDSREAQSQVESYWTAEVAAGAVVQLTDREVRDWPEIYRDECLSRHAMTVDLYPVSGSPLRAQFTCVSETADGLTAHVDHFLLRLPRRS
ncbi:MAG: hypothetical protein GY835_01330 [bacterium]|nr:hypothetical protein [bacterium]